MEINIQNVSTCTKQLNDLYLKKTIETITSNINNFHEFLHKLSIEKENTINYNKFQKYYISEEEKKLYENFYILNACKSTSILYSILHIIILDLNEFKKLLEEKYISSIKEFYSNKLKPILVLINMIKEKIDNNVFYLNHLIYIDNIINIIKNLGNLLDKNIDDINMLDIKNFHSDKFQDIFVHHLNPILILIDSVEKKMNDINLFYSEKFISIFKCTEHHNDNLFCDNCQSVYYIFNENFIFLQTLIQSLIFFDFNHENFLNEIYSKLTLENNYSKLTLENNEEKEKNQTKDSESQNLKTKNKNAKIEELKNNNNNEEKKEIINELNKEKEKSLNLKDKLNDLQKNHKLIIICYKLALFILFILCLTFYHNLKKIEELYKKKYEVFKKSYIKK